ncbi:Guanine nucleotide-binding protein subunit gamma 3-like protein [Drosera capensis]
MSSGGGGEVVVVGCQVPSLPPPRPRSPPPYPDLYGKRRELAKLQMLEREKGFLEEELKFVEGLQPASRCCKEVADFVAAKSDPLILTKKQISRSCGLWRWLWCWIMELLLLLVLLLQRVLLSSEAADLQLLFSMRLQPLQLLLLLLLLLLSKVTMLFVSSLPLLLHDDVVPEKQLQLLQIQTAFMFEIQLLRMCLLLP